MNHNAGNRHALQCSERTGLSRSLKKLGLAIILSFLSLTCQGGDGGTTGIPPTTVAFYQIDTDAAWSPDGQWILYTNTEEGNGWLWIMRPDGSEKHQITF